MREKIVFLDAATIDYGDIDFSAFAKLGHFIAYPITKENEVIERCKDASIVITNKVQFTKDVIAACPDIKLIAVSATGYNNIDVEEAKKRGILVANVPGYSTPTVAQLTMCFILALATNLLKYNEAAHDGTWSKSPFFTIGNWPFFDLEGKTVGIMGLGAIGSEVARLCTAFNMNVVTLSRDGSSSGPYKRLPLYELAAKSDFVSIHMPLTDYSKYLINKEFFSHMKKTAFLINMARGAIVNSTDLLHALQEGKIAGAAIDVMEKEPPLPDDPLLKAPNLIITPHIAWASFESRTRLLNEIAKNIEEFLKGNKRNIVNI
ncbi:MAG TPA: D-2-hydroxyacid dehydrogenase [Spirochaetota bacterium]|nr:D-2-hydroxyacid dehydrogenase [Spirochaetota bacterium]HOK91766.1 D-2-hydroxyacid dehydrogenase [Spirochaetota bacterium]HPP95479.1 D-2-hydroxyacid dehydrogenase [Spirochaetota bacterium]